MGKVAIIEAGSVDWQPVHAVVAPEVAAVMSPAERDADVRMLYPGDADGLQLFEVRFEANQEVSLHAHGEDELIHILEGEMIIGRKHLGPGSTVFVAGNTLYGFRTGTAGARFLNFRGRSNTTFLTREQFLAARAATRS